MSVIPISFTSKDRILILAPHPDDECIGAGGIMSLYPHQCDIIVLSDGCNGRKDMKPKDERRIRQKQFESEMAYIQPNSYRWLGYEDGTLSKQEHSLDDIDFSIYTKIFLPWEDDNHPDHTATFLWATKRIRKQMVAINEIYRYEVHVPFHDFTNIVDITEVIEEKKKLIHFHEDQIAALPYDIMTMALAKYRACQCGNSARYVEAYLKVNMSDIVSCKTLLEREAELQKFQNLYNLMVEWTISKQDGKKIEAYLKKKNISCISIYGFAEIGQILYRELVDGEIKIVDVFDRRVFDNVLQISAISPEKGDVSVDAVIVTAIFSFDEIKRNLIQMGYKKILSLYNIVQDL